MTVRIGVLTTAALLLVSTLLVAAQQPAWGTEEWNDYQAALRVQDPAGKAQAFRAFIQKYPESALRAYIYRDLITALYQSKKPAEVLTAVDEYLAMDRSVFEKANFDATQIQLNEYNQHSTYVLVVREMLTTGQQLTAQQERSAVRHARKGLEMQSGVRQVQSAAGANPEQLEQALQRDELAYHQVLATIFWRQKNYGEALPELSYLIEKFPEEPNLNFQVGFSYLNKSQPDVLHGIWHLARAIALKHPEAETARQMMVRQMVRYMEVAPSCMQSDIEGLIAKAAQSLHPPAGWSLVTSQQVAQARQAITYAGLFTELRGETDQAHLVWLAACGIPIGLNEQEAPTYEAVLLSFEESEVEVPGEGGAPTTKKVVTLRVAATPEALKANTPNLEIVLEGFTNIARLREKVDETIRVGGTIDSYQHDPFMIRLRDGKVDLRDIE